MKHTYRCPECDEIMVSEAEGYKCHSCDHEMSLNEAKEKFDEGELVMVVEEKDEESNLDSLVEMLNIESPEISITETFEQLFEGEELDGDFKKKAATIFESTLNEALKAHKEALDEAYKEAFVKALHEKDEELTEQVNDYLKYVVTEWVEENQPIIENRFKVERAESLLEGLRDLLEEHNVVVEHEEESLVEKLSDRVDELSEELNKEISENIRLREELDKIRAKEIQESVAEKLDLTESQREKLSKLAETVDFVNEETYSEKLEILAEAFVSGSASKEDDVDGDAVIGEDKEQPAKDDPYQKLITEVISELKKS